MLPEEDTHHAIIIFGTIMCKNIPSYLTHWISNNIPIENIFQHNDSERERILLSNTITRDIYCRQCNAGLANRSNHDNLLKWLALPLACSQAHIVHAFQECWKPFFLRASKGLPLNGPRCMHQRPLNLSMELKWQRYCVTIHSHSCGKV